MTENHSNTPAPLFLSIWEFRDAVGAPSLAPTAEDVCFDDEYPEHEDVDFSQESDELVPSVLLEVAGFEFVPVSEVGNAAFSLKSTTTDELSTADGKLTWVYTEDQLQRLVTAADWLCVRAYDVAAFIAHSFHPELGVLDSTGHAITTLDALPENTLGIDQYQVHYCGDSPLSITPPDAERPGLPPTSPAESLRYLFRRDVTKPDDYGVHIEFNDDPAYAEVVISSLPGNLPLRSQAQFEPLLVQRVDYTRNDRRTDRHQGGSPDEWSRASQFAHGVQRAIDIAHLALTQAVFAHAKGEEWVRTLEPCRRAA